jgi:polysaccharide biosynthesis/export protein
LVCCIIGTGTQIKTSNPQLPSFPPFISPQKILFLLIEPSNQGKTRSMNLKNRISFKPIWYYVVAIALLASCIPQKELMYLQDKVEKDKNYVNPYDTTQQITGLYYLKPNDYIRIEVNSLDPKVSEFFNLSSTNSASGMLQNNIAFVSYLIDDQMNIDFPYAGKINLRGCNIPLAKQRIEQALKPYLTDMSLKVNLAYSTFTILGEVRSPGVKNMSKEQITIFEALALSGDLTIYAKRKKVKLMRQTAKGPQIYVFDVTDKNIINSEYYYIYPNDFIYIKPMKAKIFGIGESFTFGIITTAVATYLTISALAK